MGAHPVDEKAFLLSEAARFRRLAWDILDTHTEQVLQAMAAEYEARAASIRPAATVPAKRRRSAERRGAAFPVVAGGDPAGTGVWLPVVLWS